METIDIGLLFTCVAASRSLDPDKSDRILQTILSRLRPPDPEIVQKTSTDTS